MAEFCRAQSRQITRGCISFLGVLGSRVLAAPCTFAQTLYKRPVLVTESGYAYGQGHERQSTPQAVL